MKRIFTGLLVFVLMIGLASCGGEKTTTNNTTNETPKSENASTKKIKGTEVETDFMTITVLDGWTKWDVTGGIQIYKGTEALQIALEGENQSEGYPKIFIEQAISAYEGEPIEEVSMWGKDFYMTRYEASGTHQTHYATMYGDEGKMLVVKANTKTRELTPDIKAMMDSVVLK